MKKAELYTDYLISTFGAAKATGMSAMVDGEVSHDRVTRFLAEREYTSKDLWKQVKSTVRQIEREDGVLIFDDTIQENAWTDENEVMCWHYDHVVGAWHQFAQCVVSQRWRFDSGRIRAGS